MVNNYSNKMMLVVVTIHWLYQ